MRRRRRLPPVPITAHVAASPLPAAGVPPALRRRPEFHGSTLAVRARVGGLATQLVYAGAHLTAHLLSAVSLLLLLELGIEVMMQYEGIGKDGYHSL